jgi:hypothetical protein
MEAPAMSLPRYAVARMTRLRYVRFALDHQQHTAAVLNVGPQEAAQSSANGLWIVAQIEPFAEVQAEDALAGQSLRLMGYPFNGQLTYGITAPDATAALTAHACRVVAPSARTGEHSGDSSKP